MEFYKLVSYYYTYFMINFYKRYYIYLLAQLYYNEKYFFIIKAKEKVRNCIIISTNIYVTPWNIISYKSMFNCIYYVIWLYDRLEWVEVFLELVMCEFLDMDVE